MSVNLPASYRALRIAVDLCELASLDLARWHQGAAAHSVALGDIDAAVKALGEARAALLAEVRR